VRRHRRAERLGRFITAPLDPAVRIPSPRLSQPRALSALSITAGAVRLPCMASLDAVPQLVTHDDAAPLLAPIEHPKRWVWRLAFAFMRRKFGKVMTPASVFSARMPLAFTSYYGKVGKLDKKLVLPRDTAELIREQVATLNGCAFCMDATKATVLQRSADAGAKLQELHRYGESEYFTEAERAALDYVSELTRTKAVDAATFAALRRHYSEREICDIVWLVASEHLFNLNNLALNIGSDGLCELLARP
jgi:AhpD family alkylhydroperoxidase